MSLCQRSIHFLFLLGFAFTLISGPCVSAQAEDYQSGVLVLNDGRILAMRGSYEVLGDEVQFLDDRGERVSLPLKLVDLEKTDEQNRLIRERSVDKTKIVDDGSLYSKIMRDKAKREREAKNKPINVNSDNLNQTQDAPQQQATQTRSLPNLSAQEVKGQVESIFRDLRDKLPVSTTVLIALAAIIAVLALVSLITEIYILFTSYQDSSAWGLVISIFFLASFVFPILGPFVIDSSVLVLGLNSLIGLGRFLSVLLYIILVFPGNRLRIFLFWSGAIWFSLISGIVLVVMAL